MVPLDPAAPKMTWLQTRGFGLPAVVVTRPNLAPVENGLKLDLIDAAGGRLVEQYDIGPLASEASAAHTRPFGQGLAIPVAGQTLIIPPAKPGG